MRALDGLSGSSLTKKKSIGRPISFAIRACCPSFFTTPVRAFGTKLTCATRMQIQPECAYKIINLPCKRLRQPVERLGSTKGVNGLHFCVLIGIHRNCWLRISVARIKSLDVSIFPTFRAGTPAIVVPGSTNDLFTTALAPIAQPSAIVIPP